MKISQRKLGTFVFIGLAIYFFGFDYLPSIVLVLLFWVMFLAASLFVFRGWKKFFVALQSHQTKNIAEGPREKK